MYTAQKNPAALRSQELICKAVCALMGELPFDEITVTRICQEAGVGRKTFYRNFERELLHVPVEEAVRYHFTFLSQRMEFMKLLHAARQIALLNSRFSQVQPRVMPRWSGDERENAYRTAAVVAGTEAVIRLWAERGFRERVEELERLYAFAMGVRIPGKEDL